MSLRLFLCFGKALSLRHIRKNSGTKSCHLSDVICFDFRISLRHGILIFFIYFGHGMRVRTCFRLFSRRSARSSPSDCTLFPSAARDFFALSRLIKTWIRARLRFGVIQISLYGRSARPCRFHRRRFPRPERASAARHALFRINSRNACIACHGAFIAPKKTVCKPRSVSKISFSWVDSAKRLPT